MADLKISQLAARTELTGTELVTVAADGQNFRVAVSDLVADAVVGTATKTSIGLGNVDNTSDANKPVSTAQQAALDLKANISALTTKADAVHAHVVEDVTGLQAALDAKANAADVTTAIALKADLTALASKAETTDVNTALATKADDAATTLALGTKANASDVATALAGKADATALDAKADAADMATALGLKADTLALAAKADLVHVHAIADVTGLQSALDNKTDTTAVQAMIEAVVGTSPEALDTIQEIAAALQNDPNVVTAIQNGLALKADTTSVNDALALKANITDVNTALAAKADLVLLDDKADAAATTAALVLKADAADLATTNTAVATKADLVHTHVIADVTGLQAELDAKALATDIAGFQTAIDSKVSLSDLIDGLGTKANNSHLHVISEVDGLQTALDNKADSAATTTALAGKADITMLAAKADITHAHDISDVTGLQTAIDSKASVTHNHVSTDLSDLAAFIQSIKDSMKPEYSVNITGISSNDVNIDVDYSTTNGYCMAAYTMLVQVKKVADSVWTNQSIPFTDGTLSYSFNFAGLDASTPYDLKVTFTDANTTAAPDEVTDTFTTSDPA